MLPNKQGSLDAACGLYAAVDAIKYAIGDVHNIFGDEIASALWNGDDRFRLPEAIARALGDPQCGTTDDEMKEIVNKAASAANELLINLVHEAKISAPFQPKVKVVEYELKGTTVDDIFKELKEIWDFLKLFTVSDAEDHAALIIGVSGLEDHWYAVEGVTSRQLAIIDQDTKRINASTFSINDRSKRIISKKLWGIVLSRTG